MDFIIKNLQESIVSVARSIGYVIIDTKENGEHNLVRKLNRDNYPRFHVYVTQQPARTGGGNNFNFSLHLDQKKPVYENSGSHAHNGEYFGPIIDGEADRIKRELSSKKVDEHESHGSGWEN